MRTAIVRGYATATVKHKSLEGWRLMLVQPVNDRDEMDGPPQLVIDPLGAALHQKVLISSDGASARKLLRSEASPARWTVAGIVDPAGTPCV